MTSDTLSTANTTTIYCSQCGGYQHMVMVTIPNDISELPPIRELVCSQCRTVITKLKHEEENSAIVRYRYKVLEVQNGVLEQTLNRLGRDGWRCIKLHQQSDQQIHLVFESQTERSH